MKRARKKDNIESTKKSPAKNIMLENVQKEVMVGYRASDEEFKGKYCNVAVVKHTEREFIFDFILLLDSQSVLSSRIITSPKHAKQISEVLSTNIQNYEKQFGQILSETKKT